jgi:hypothetical protein
MLWAGTSVSTIFCTPPHWYRRAVVSVNRKEEEKSGPWDTVTIHTVFCVVKR